MRVLFLIFFLFPSVGWTQELATVEVLCQKLPQFQEENGAAYQPGVDVKGQSVVPADLNDHSAFEVLPLNIPIEVNLIEKFGLEVPDGIDLEPKAAQLQVYPNGRVEYNGQDVTNQTVSMCKKEPQKNGQSASDPVSSEGNIDGQFLGKPKFNE